MTVWTIENPSDPYTFEGDNYEAACVANCILGHGATSLKDASEEDLDCPLFLFGGHDIFFQEKFNKSFEESLQQMPKPEIAKILNSILIGEPCDREVFECSSFTWEEWHDARLTSCNDMDRKAKALAQTLLDLGE